jgi:hypothetical protein
MQPQQQDDVITLNVGGTLFSTTRSTLMRDSECMLARMFSKQQQMSLTRDSAGNVFIDRDGTHFRHILNYLRCGALPNLPPEARKELILEADFYQISGLVEALQGGGNGRMEEAGFHTLAADTLKAIKHLHGEKYEEFRKHLLQSCLNNVSKGKGSLKEFFPVENSWDVIHDVLRALLFELRNMGLRHSSLIAHSTGFTVELHWLPVATDPDRHAKETASHARRVEIVNWHTFHD